MIAYLDSSSLVKLYAEETGSGDVRELIAQSDRRVTSWLSYVEVKTAFNRKRRERILNSARFAEIQGDFDADWSAFDVLQMTPEILKLACDMTLKHSIRTLDATHLASSIFYRHKTGIRLSFSTFDEKLKRAAAKERFKIPAKSSTES